MRSFLFFVLIIYAVRCEDNYYVIEVPEEPFKLSDSRRSFTVYWNVPTMQCASKKIPFDNLDRFGIIQNKGDTFRGDKISILYDPGLFPALLKNESSGKYKFRNGGVPQEGDLEKHLEAFRDIMDTSVPDPNFNGVGIIDFESWRPVFRQNFGVLVPYKDVSIEIERKLHWWWPKNWMQAEAKRRFEEAARRFMQTTVSVAKQMRPHALWGYYGFPYCFNMANKHMVETCADNVNRENDGMYWLWAESTALYPSVYSSAELSAPQLGGLIRGRVREAARVRTNGTPILPYFWFRYREGGYLRQGDLDMALKTFYKSGADGFIIWGSSKDVNTAEKCTELRDYIENVMGPAIAKYATNESRSENDVFFEDNNHNNTNSHNDNERNRTQTQPDPEYHWVPPENYVQNIEQHVKELIKNSRYNSTDENETNPSPERNALLDIVLHLLMNEKQNNTETDTSTTNNGKRDVTTEIYSNTQDNYSTEQEFTSTTEQDITSTTEQEFTSTTEQDITLTTEQEMVSTTEQDITSTTEQEFTSTTEQDITLTTEQEMVSTTEQDITSTTEKDITLTTENLSTIYPDFGVMTAQNILTEAITTEKNNSGTDIIIVDFTKYTTTTKSATVTETTPFEVSTDVTTPEFGVSTVDYSVAVINNKKNNSSILDVNTNESLSTNKNDKKGIPLDHSHNKTSKLTTTDIPSTNHVFHSKGVNDNHRPESEFDDMKSNKVSSSPNFEESSSSETPVVNQVDY